MLQNVLCTSNSISPRCLHGDDLLLLWYTYLGCSFFHNGRQWITYDDTKKHVVFECRSRTCIVWGMSWTWWTKIPMYDLNWWQIDDMCMWLKYRWLSIASIKNSICRNDVTVVAKLRTSKKIDASKFFSVKLLQWQLSSARWPPHVKCLQVVNMVCIMRILFCNATQFSLRKLHNVNRPFDIHQVSSQQRYVWITWFEIKYGHPQSMWSITEASRRQSVDVPKSSQMSCTPNVSSNLATVIGLLREMRQ